ncbi:DNA polymerase subunit beta, partial [Corallococcus praedator]
MNPQLSDRLHASAEAIASFCQQRQIVELALFGSVLRNDFRPDSDVDVLVTFASDAKISLFD